MRPKYKAGDFGYIVQTFIMGEEYKHLFQVLEVQETKYLIYNYTTKISYHTIPFHDFDETTRFLTTEEKIELL